MDTTTGAITALFNQLIKLGALTEESLGTVTAPMGTVSREWLTAYEGPVRACIGECKKTLATFIGTDGEVDGAGLIECALMAESALSAPSLDVPRPALSSVCLLVSRMFDFLRAGLEFCTAAGAELKLITLQQASLILLREIASTAARDRPHSEVAPYKRELALFEQVSGNEQAAQAVVEIALQTLRSISKAPPNKAASYMPPASAPASKRGGPIQWTDAAPDILAYDAAPTAETPVISPEVIDPSKRKTDQSYVVWYGTNRAPIQPSDPAFGFSEKVDNRLHFGMCSVFVPLGHIEGSLGSSWLKRAILLRADDRLELESITPRTRDEFQKDISIQLAACRDNRTALVYVHGFRNTFEEAALRAAQIACDLSVNGVTAFFSWPSAGEVAAYPQDEESVQVTVDRFLEFLDTLLQVNGLERADIVAHSMGNRLLARVMEKLSTSKWRSRVGHLILAAPDIARIEFDELFQYYQAVTSKRVTLYACARDRALKISTKLHRYMRLGYEPPVFCKKGLDTISARNIALDLLGHGYFASAAPVIADLKKLLWGDMAPANRGLTPVPNGTIPEYWLLP